MFVLIQKKNLNSQNSITDTLFSCAAVGEMLTPYFESGQTDVFFCSHVPMANFLKNSPSVSLFSGAIHSCTSHETSFKTGPKLMGFYWAARMCEYRHRPACLLDCKCMCFASLVSLNGPPFIYFSILPEGTRLHTKIH